jgi:hypothetical protein
MSQKEGAMVVQLVDFPDNPTGRRYAEADRERAYQLWRSTAGRSYRRVGESLDIAVSTLSAWAQRERWMERAKREDAAERESVRLHVEALFDAEVIDSIEKIRKLRDTATNEKVQLEAAMFLLAMAGHAPAKQVHAKITGGPGERPRLPPLTDEERAHLSARITGDVMTSDPLFPRQPARRVRGRRFVGGLCVGMSEGSPSAPPRRIPNFWELSRGLDASQSLPPGRANNDRVGRMGIGRGSTACRRTLRTREDTRGGVRPGSSAARACATRVGDWQGYVRHRMPSDSETRTAKPRLLDRWPLDGTVEI